MRSNERLSSRSQKPHLLISKDDNQAHADGEVIGLISNGPPAVNCPISVLRKELRAGENSLEPLRRKDEDEAQRKEDKPSQLAGMKNGRDNAEASANSRRREQ